MANLPPKTLINLQPSAVGLTGFAILVASPSSTLRDRYGITQVVFNPAHTKAPAELVIDKLRSEFVIKVEGHVGIRPDGQANKKIATGEIEFNADHLEILNTCETPPFVPSQKDLPGEDHGV